MIFFAPLCETRSTSIVRRQLAAIVAPAFFNGDIGLFILQGIRHDFTVFTGDFQQQIDAFSRALPCSVTDMIGVFDVTKAFA